MMTLTQDPIQRAADRSQQYWVSDGIPQIVMGGFWVLWGAVVLIPALFPRTATPRAIAVPFILALSGAGLLMKRLIHGWKERVTFPRTGYIELRQPGKLLRYGVPTVAFVIAFGIALLARFQERSWREWMPLGLGLMLAAGLLVAARKMRNLRLVFGALLVAGTAFAAYALRWQEDMSMGLPLLAAGVVCVADGLLVLRSYMRAHPAPAGDGQ